MGYLGKTICGLFLRDVFRQYSLLLRNFLFIFLANDSWMVNFKCDMCTLIYIFKNSYLYYLRSFILTRKSYILGFGNYLIYLTKGGGGQNRLFARVLNILIYMWAWATCYYSWGFSLVFQQKSYAKHIFIFGCSTILNAGLWEHEMSIVCAPNHLLKSIE